MDTRGMLLKMRVGESLFFPDNRGGSVFVTRTNKRTWRIFAEECTIDEAVALIDN